jgi:hypothetical protein
MFPKLHQEPFGELIVGQGRANGTKTKAQTRKQWFKMWYQWRKDVRQELLASFADRDDTRLPPGPAAIHEYLIQDTLILVLITINGCLVPWESPTSANT